MSNHIVEYKLSTFYNVDVVQVTNFTEKRKTPFFIGPLGIKLKFLNIIARLKVLL